MSVEIGLKRINEKKGKKLVFKTEGSGCIVVTSHDPNKDGYIRIYSGKGVYPRMQFVHRMAWVYKNGPVPEGHELDHKCRNRACCNPDHLQLLTVSQHKTKTNLERYAERTLAISEEIKNGFNVKDIAAKYQVSTATVNRIKRKQNAIH